MEYLAIACRALIGVTFAASAAGKAWRRAAFDAFVTDLAGMAVLPGRLTRAAAVGAVLAEAVIALAMLSARTCPAGAILAVAVLGAFITAIATVMRRGTVARCACFGPGGSPLGVPHLVRNALLVLAAGTVAAGAATAGNVAAGAATASPGLAGTVLALAAGAVAATVVVRLDDLVTLFAEA